MSVYFLQVNGMVSKLTRNRYRQVDSAAQWRCRNHNSVHFNCTWNLITYPLKYRTNACQPFELCRVFETDDGTLNSGGDMGFEHLEMFCVHFVEKLRINLMSVS